MHDRSVDECRQYIDLLGVTVLDIRKLRVNALVLTHHSVVGKHRLEQDYDDHPDRDDHVRWFAC